MTLQQLPQCTEDEVRLQQGSELENQLIIRYPDRSGNMVLPVPSEPLPNAEQAIAEELQQAGSQRSGAIR